MKGSELVLDYVHLMFYKCNKTNPNGVRSYIGSPDWIKDKKVIINFISKKDKKWLQHDVTVALNHKEMGKHAERITKIKLFINKYKWKGIKFSFEKDDSDKFEKKYEKSIVIVLYVKRENIYPAYVSKIK